MESCGDSILEVTEKCDNTSPGQLQRVTMEPDLTDSRSDTGGLVTSGSRTMKEYEEQMAALRKDNFNLKLRVYFLEERLEASAPHDTFTQHNLTMQNIELKVSLENLRREANERKELLCVAARALELVETTAAKREAELLAQLAQQQEELARLRGDSVGDESEAPVEDSVALYTAAFNLQNSCAAISKEELPTPRELSHPGSLVSEVECSEDNVGTISEEKIQLERLKQENTNACQMVQGCLKRIYQMEKDNEKLRASLQRKEDRVAKLQCQVRQAGLRPASEVQDTPGETGADLVEKYKQMLQLKENQISDLEDEIKSLSSKKDDLNKSLIKKNNEECEHDSKTINPKGSSNDQPRNIEEMLTSRLQEMAYFLDSLLSHRCILGEEKRLKVEQLLEKSLELPVGIKFDPSASRLLEDSFMDRTLDFSRLSHTFRLEDITALLGHHDSTLLRPLSGVSEESAHIDLQDVHKKELVINKSFQQLKSHHVHLSSSTDDLDKIILPNDKTSHSEFSKLYLKKNKAKMIRGVNSRVNASWHGPEAGAEDSESWSEPDRSVSLARMGLPPPAPSCPTSPDRLLRALSYEKQRLSELLEISEAKILQLEKDFEIDRKNYTSAMKEKDDEIASLKQTQNDLHQSDKVNQNKLENLEKEKDILKKELEKSNNFLSDVKTCLEEERRQHLELAEWRERQLAAEREAVIESEGGEEVERCPSPDQGIDSDRLSSLEHPGPVSLKEENCILRKRLIRCEEKLQMALGRLQVTASHQNRHERAICHQIHKTTSLLRQVRGNITE